MRTTRTLGIAACIAISLAACNEAPAPIDRPADVPPSMTPPTPLATPTPAGTKIEAAPTATDSAATNPMGTLTKEAESKSMPMAGQGNNHSSPSLETGAKK